MIGLCSGARTRRLVVAAVVAAAPALALAGHAGSTRDLVLDFERSGVLKDLLAKTLSIAKSFLFLSAFLAYLIEAFGRSPVAGRDYAAVTWRLVIVLFLLWNYQAVFGGVIGLIDGLEQQVAPASTWRAFIDEAGDMRKALQDVAAHGEGPTRSADGAAAATAPAPSMVTSWVYDALIACVQLVAEAAVFIVNWLSRILTATLFVIGPLALVAAIPRPSGTGTRWFVRFVTIASWPVFSGVLLSVLVTLGAQGAMRQTYLECLVGALVMLVTALATPLLASHVIGGALENAASHGYGAAKAAHHDAVRPVLRLAGSAAAGVAGRAIAIGGAVAHGVSGGGGATGGPASGGGGGHGSAQGGGVGGAVANPPGGAGRTRGGSGRRGRAEAEGARAQPPGGAGAPSPRTPEQGGVVANPPAPPVPAPPGPGEGRGSGGSGGGPATGPAKA